MPGAILKMTANSAAKLEAYIPKMDISGTVAW